MFVRRKVAFFIEYSKTKKSKCCCHPPFHPPIFCRHSLKLLSPSPPKLMNWILLSLRPLSSDLTPPKFGTCMHKAAFLPPRTRYPSKRPINTPILPFFQFPSRSLFRKMAACILLRDPTEYHMGPHGGTPGFTSTPYLVPKFRLKDQKWA